MPERGQLAGLRLAQVGYGHCDATRLIAQVQQEYVVRYGGPDESPVEPVLFEPPSGSFFVGYVDHGAGEVEAVATGAWRRTDVSALGTRRTAEIKRMYVVPTARGAGHARTMLTHLELSASAAGVGALLLETGTRQPEAIALYQSSGYIRVPGFGHYRDAPLSRCFGKRLVVDSVDS